MQKKLPNTQEEQLATRESQFFNTVCVVEDTAETQTLRTLCRAMPDNFEVLVVLSDCLGLQKRYTEAIVVLNRAMDLAPRSPVGYRRRAQMERMCLRFSEAQSDFAYSRELDPEQAEILYDLGVSEYMLAHYEEARTWLMLALEEAEDPAQRCAIRYWTVLACSNLGDTATIQTVLANFDEQEDAGENQTYCKAMRLFAGSCEPDAMLRFLNTESEDHDYATELYAVCIWLESNQRWGEAAELRQKLLSRDRDWDCLAYLAAAADADWAHLE